MQPPAGLLQLKIRYVRFPPISGKKADLQSSQKCQKRTPAHTREPNLASPLSQTAAGPGNAVDILDAFKGKVYAPSYPKRDLIAALSGP
jgi:hypothetical protein